MIAAVMACSWGAFTEEAQASCGDYLLHRGMLDATHDSAEQSASSVPAPVQHRPCSGPGCRRTPPSAPIVPPPVELTLRHDLVAFLIHAEIAPSILCGQLELESEQSLAGHILGILRPPIAA